MPPKKRKENEQSSESLVKKSKIETASATKTGELSEEEIKVTGEEREATKDTEKVQWLSYSTEPQPGTYDLDCELVILHNKNKMLKAGPEDAMRAESLASRLLKCFIIVLASFRNIKKVAGCLY